MPDSTIRVATSKQSELESQHEPTKRIVLNEKHQKFTSHTNVGASKTHSQTTINFNKTQIITGINGSSKLGSAHLQSNNRENSRDVGSTSSVNNLYS